MKLPAHLLEFVGPHDGPQVTTLEQLVETWLSENESDTGEAVLSATTEIELYLSLSRSDHDLLWLVVQQLAKAAKTKFQLVMVAAGPLEDLIARSGPDYIDKIETLARQSIRFKYVLTGVWPQGQKTTETWKRIEAIRAPMMPKGIDSNAEIPKPDLP